MVRSLGNPQDHVFIFGESVGGDIDVHPLDTAFILDLTSQIDQIVILLPKNLNCTRDNVLKRSPGCPRIMDQIGGEPLLFGFCSISIGEE